MDLGNTHEALVHFLLIIGMPCLGHYNEFLMVSALIHMVTYWIELMMNVMSNSVL